MSALAEVVAVEMETAAVADVVPCAVSLNTHGREGEKNKKKKEQRTTEFCGGLSIMIMWANLAVLWWNCGSQRKFLTQYPNAVQTSPHVAPHPHRIPQEGKNDTHRHWAFYFMGAYVGVF